MSLNDLFYLQPYMWLALGGLVVLFMGLLPAGRKWAFRITILVLLGTLLASLGLLDQNRTIEGFILVNGFTQSAIMLFCVIAIAVIFMSKNSEGIREGLDEIYYALIIFSVMGMALIPSDNLIALLIGVEMVTICGFCLTAWKPDRFGAVEAATKYVVTAGIATGFILMGLALIYAGSGTVIVSQVYEGMNTDSGSIVLVLSGFFLLLAGVGFELAVAPFHCWLADVYEGAPAPVVAFIGTIAKLAVLAWLALLPVWLDARLWVVIKPVFTVLAIISMVPGTILALRQQNLKRLLAYSSVAHFGFILVALAVYQQASIAILSYYSIVYAITTVAAFAIIVFVEKKQGISDLSQYRGVGRRFPLIGISMAIVMLSLGGIPPLAGFFAKLMLFQLAINHGSYLLAIIMALSSAAALYYYIRVLLIIFDRQKDSVMATESTTLAPSLQSGLKANTLVILFSVVLTVLLGIVSQPVLNYVSHMLR